MKKIVSIIVAAIVCCSFFIPAIAADSSGSNSYNVVIAMDASGSLEDTDPHNYRLNAVNLFIQLLANNNNKLGCLSFATDTLNPKKLTAINQSSEKKAVFDNLKSTAETEVAKNGWTNIGSALQNAVKDIKANGDPSLPSVILLLSDGNTEMPTDKEKQESLDEKADAVQAARDQDIAIYSVCLNANGKADKKEMEQISKATGGKCIEIKRAEDLQNALTTFYSMIYGTSVKTIVDKTFDSNGRIEVPFTVPGVGVDEINIIIYGKAKDIVTRKPDQSVAKSELFDAETFSFLKINDIMPGKWAVELSGVPGDKVKIDLLLNSDLSVLTSISPDGDSFNPQDPITFEALLNSENQSGASGSTDGYKATLRIRDKYGEVVNEMPMKASGNSFLLETNLDEGLYKYSAVVEGYNILKESAVKGPIRVSSKVATKEESENTPPEPVEDPYDVPTINLWPFKDNTYALDVTGLATDDQEEPLEYRIESSSYIENEDYTFDGETITITDFSLSKGEFLMNAYDKFGESCQITVHVKTRNIGLISVILFASLAVIVLIALLVVGKILADKPFMGEITVTNIRGYQSATQRKSRGKIKLSAFLVGSTGLDSKSYFQATGKNFIYYVSKNPVEGDSVVGKAKKIRIENNFDTRIYADPSHESGIEVRFNSFKS